MTEERQITFPMHRMNYFNSKGLSPGIGLCPIYEKDFQNIMETDFK